MLGTRLESDSTSRATSEMFIMRYVPVLELEHHHGWSVVEDPQWPGLYLVAHKASCRVVAHEFPSQQHASTFIADYVASLLQHGFSADRLFDILKGPHGYEPWSLHQKRGEMWAAFRNLCTKYGAKWQQ